MSFSEALLGAQHATRIVVFAPPAFSRCLLHCLDFHEISYHFFQKGADHHTGEDYFIFQTQDAEEFMQIRPNITFIAPSENNMQHPSFLQSIVNGGVLVYNEKDVAINTQLESTAGFFRKLAYEDAHFEIKDSQAFLNTDFSQIPLAIEDVFLMQNIKGLQILAQQLGVMEEEFYEALMDFEHQ